MKLWLRSDEGVYRDLFITPAGHNDKIRVWADQSGNGNDFFQSDTDKQPFLINQVLCGKPVLRFDVTRRTFLQSLMRLSGPKTVLIVFNLRPFVNAAQTLLSLKGLSSEFTEMVATDFSGYRPVTFISDLPSTTGGSLWRNSAGIQASFSTQGNLVTMMYNGSDLSTPSSYDAYYDNASASVMTNGVLGRYVYDSTTIGARAPYHNINFLNGDIAEILVYDRLLTAPEITDVSDYLIYKYGLMGNCVLSIRMRYFRVVPGNNQVDISWRMEEEENTDRYEVQHSADGRVWQTIQTVPARHSVNNPGEEYSVIHRQPVRGWNFYRVIAFNDFTKVFISDVRKVFFDPGSTMDPKIFPNPATEKIYMGNNWRHLHSVRLISAEGRLIRKISPAALPEIHIADLPPGIYFLQVLGDDVQTTFKFIKE